TRPTLGGGVNAGGPVDYVCEYRIASNELREAKADRPILFRGVQNVHEYVLWPDAGTSAEQVRDPPEQRLFLFRGAGAEHGDLDKHKIVTASDAKSGAVAEVRSVMLADGHELVAFGYVERFAHCGVKAIEDGLSVGFGFSGAQ